MTKEINGKITLLLNSEGLHLELYDADSNIKFVEVRLNQEQTCQALSRLAYTDCQKMTINNLEYVGKTRISEPLVFEIDDVGFSDRKEIAKQKAIELCGDEWTPDLYFDSQNSFSFNHETQKYTCRTRKMKWIDKDAS